MNRESLKRNVEKSSETFQPVTAKSLWHCKTFPIVPPKLTKKLPKGVGLLFSNNAHFYLMSELSTPFFYTWFTRNVVKIRKREKKLLCCI